MFSQRQPGVPGQVLDIGSDDHIKRQILNWIGWKVLLPLLLLFLIWPMYGWVLHLPHPFVRAFAHGDLLIFSSLILLEAAIEGEHIPHQSFWSLFGRVIAKIFAVVFIAIYGVLKYKAVLNEDELAKAVTTVHSDPAAVASLSSTIIDGMLPYSYFSCTIAIVSVIFSVLAFWKNVHLEQTLAYQRLAEGPEQPQQGVTG
jgi:hypothetical protein